MKSWFFGAVALTIAAFSMGSTAVAGDGWIIVESPHDVAVTADKLTAAVEKAGATVFARVDHAAGAKKVGADLADATLVIFGNPKIGTPIMQSNLKAGLDLPIRVLIWSQDGKTQLGTLDPATLKARYELGDGADGALGAMKGALGKLMGAATQ